MFERIFRKLGYYSERQANLLFRPKAAAYQFYCQYLGSDDIVVEAGAFRGFTTVGMLVNFVRFVYGFEPDPVNFKHLKDNSRGLERRLRIFNLGLGDHEEVAEMRGSGAYMSFVSGDSSSGARARVVTLDSLGLDPSPTVLIFDCEGMEVEAIRGAERTMARSVHSVLVEIHGGTEPKVREILSQAGFADIQSRKAGWNKEGAYHSTWVLARRVLPSNT
jgi:FkbM family methyltransferase